MEETKTYFYQADYTHQGYIEADDIYDAILKISKELKNKNTTKEQIGTDVSLRVWRTSEMGNLNND